MKTRQDGGKARLLSLLRGFSASSKIGKMSSRVLRKLQGGNELDISRDDEEDEDEFHFLPVTSKKTKEKALANPFDLVCFSLVVVPHEGQPKQSRF